MLPLYHEEVGRIEQPKASETELIVKLCRRMIAGSREQRVTRVKRLDGPSSALHVQVPDRSSAKCARSSAIGRTCGVFCE